MPIIKSAIKRDRQSKTHRSFNRAIKANVKRSMRSVIDPISNHERVDGNVLSRAFSTIDRAVKKGVLHKNTAARKKSRITRIFNQASPQTDVAPKTDQLKKTKTTISSTKKAPIKKALTTKKTTTSKKSVAKKTDK